MQAIRTAEIPAQLTGKALEAVLIEYERVCKENKDIERKKICATVLNMYGYGHLVDAKLREEIKNSPVPISQITVKDGSITWVKIVTRSEFDVVNCYAFSFYDKPPFTDELPEPKQSALSLREYAKYQLEDKPEVINALISKLNNEREVVEAELEKEKIAIPRVGQLIELQEEQKENTYLANLAFLGLLASVPSKKDEKIVLPAETPKINEAVNSIIELASLYAAKKVLEDIKKGKKSPEALIKELDEETAKNILLITHKYA